MDVDFTDLELMAQMPLDFDPQELLNTKVSLYETVPLRELFDLLESAVESYTLVRNHLAASLRESAEQEIEFFLSLLQERLDALLESTQAADLQRQFQLI